MKARKGKEARKEGRKEAGRKVRQRKARMDKIEVRCEIDTPIPPE